MKKKGYSSSVDYKDKGRSVNREVFDKTVSDVYRNTGKVVRMGKSTLKGLDFGNPKGVKKSFKKEGLRF